LVPQWVVDNATLMGSAQVIALWVEILYYLDK